NRNGRRVESRRQRIYCPHHNHHRQQHVGTLKENVHIMRKTLITFAIAAFASTTLVACGTEADIDTSISNDQVGERVPEGVEVVDNNSPITYSHLAGSSAPDGVGVICAGDYAFLVTCSTEADIDTSYTNVQVAERVPECVEVVANTSPISYSYLAGSSSPDGVGVI